MERRGNCPLPCSVCAHKESESFCLCSLLFIFALVSRAPLFSRFNCKRFLLSEREFLSLRFHARGFDRFLTFYLKCLPANVNVKGSLRAFLLNEHFLLIKREMTCLFRKVLA